VETQALAKLFELFTDSVECILLNACYSQIQATAIAQHIGFTIGMNKAIGDRAAIEFALGFYDALGAGRTYDIAYKFACNAIHLVGIDEYLTPDLIKQGEQAPPAKVVSSSVPDFSRTVTPPTPTFSSGEAVQTLVVSAMGRGDYRTISEAMNAAKDGAKILVKEGFYREGLVINKPVEIIGDGETSEIILEYSDSYCISMQTDYAKVKGLTICGQAGLKGKKFFAVDIPQGCLVLEDCDITSDSLSCISIHGLTAKPRISHCKIHDSKEDGIFVYEKGQGIVEDCDIFANTLTGVEIKEEANPTIRRCKIHDGKSAGILVWQTGQGIVEDCDIFTNTYAGVEIREEGNPIIQKCRINRNGYEAIWSHDNGRGTVENCDLTDNKGGAFNIDPTSQVQQSNNKT
jgi:parallel beta-helix repeat protein